MDWKEILSETDFTKTDTNFALPVKVNSYNIDGQNITIPDWNEMANMLFELNRAWTSQYFKKNMEGFTDKFSDGLAELFGKIIDRIKTIEEKLAIINSDTTDIKNELNKIKLDIDPKYFINNMLTIEPIKK